MSQVTRELVTLQLGQYANFVGTHWWNLQEASFVYNATTPTDINHDFLFREGITHQRQETYTPRLLVIDVKGSLHSLPVQGTLYSDLGAEPSASEASWDGQVDLIQQLPQEKNEFLRDLEQEDAKFHGPTDEDKDICIDDTRPPETDSATTKKVYDLANSVQVWSDFLRPHLHPKSIYLFDNLHNSVGRASGESGENVWGFSSGFSAYQRESVEEEITDRIRSIAESCDSLQGFQVLSDIHDGMGGVTCGILQHLADEYGSKDSITFATSPPHLRPATVPSRVLTQASILQSFTEMSKLSGVLVPLNLHKSLLDFEAPSITFPHLVVKEHNAYLTSSIIAAFLDTVSLVYRSRTSPTPFASVVDILTPTGRKIAGGSLALPLGMSSNQSLLDWLHQGQDASIVSVSAGCTFNLEPISEVLTVRGVPASRLNRSDTKLQTRRIHTSTADLYCQFLESSLKPPRIRIVGGARDPLKITPPFPSIFSQCVTNEGYITCDGTVLTGPTSAPCLAGLHQGGGLASLLQELLMAAKKVDVMKIPSLLEEGMDKESWTGLIEDLQGIANSYHISNQNIESSDED